jgi:hypothetical protein
LGFTGRTLLNLHHVLAKARVHQAWQHSHFDVPKNLFGKFRCAVGAGRVAGIEQALELGCDHQTMFFNVDQSETDTVRLKVSVAFAHPHWKSVERSQRMKVTSKTTASKHTATPKTIKAAGSVPLNFLTPLAKSLGNSSVTVLSPHAK